MTAGAQVAPPPAPLAGMVLVGVAVFAVTGLAFFRVPLLPSTHTVLFLKVGGPTGSGGSLRR